LNFPEIPEITKWLEETMKNHQFKSLEIVMINQTDSLPVDIEYFLLHAYIQIYLLKISIIDQIFI
jgi:hypothetical protein